MWDFWLAWFEVNHNRTQHSRYVRKKNTEFSDRDEEERMIKEELEISEKYNAHYARTNPQKGK